MFSPRNYKEKSVNLSKAKAKVEADEKQPIKSKAEVTEVSSTEKLKKKKVKKTKKNNS